MTNRVAPKPTPRFLGGPDAAFHQARLVRESAGSPESFGAACDAADAALETLADAAASVGPDAASSIVTAVATMKAAIAIARSTYGSAPVAEARR